MNTLIFHIGLPKTGSSALQVFLAHNHAKLLSQSVEYFKIGQFIPGAAGNITSGNGALVARRLLPRQHPASLADSEQPVKDLLDAVDKSACKIGLLSSELFADADQSAFQALLENLRNIGINSKIYVLIRSQTQILCSHYMQQVKRHGCTDGPQEYIMRMYKHVQFLKYNKYYDFLINLVGAENVHVDVYDRAIKNGGIYKSFLDTFFIEDINLDFSIKDVNTSMSAKEIAIMLLLNKFKPRMMFSDTVVENSNWFGSSKSGGIHNLLSADQVEEITNYFRDENAKLAERLFNGQELFPMSLQAASAEAVSESALTTRDLIAFFGGLLVRYDHRLAHLEAQIMRHEEILRGFSARKD